MRPGSRALARIAEHLPAYELGAELGRGSWGVVYAGLHRHLDRDVAIKILPQAFAADPTVRNRFLREARLAASLNHPHIVPVFDFLVLDDGSSVIVMERCSGSIARVTDADGWSHSAACAAALSTLSALGHAHRAGVLHRDVKPENLLIGIDRVVKLADFGIARGEADDVRLTATGTVLGTPAYMSPEQASGERLGPTSDLYSTGVMLFELLTGRLPFSSAMTVGALIKAHLMNEPPDADTLVPAVGRPISQVVARALAKQPDQRWPSADEFAAALRQAALDTLGPGWIGASGFSLHGDPAAVAGASSPEVVGHHALQIGLELPSGEVRVAAGERVVIGRQSGLDITIDETSVSREHAVLLATPGGGWRVLDLDSTNGTFVNESPVTEADVAVGDELRLGSFALRLVEPPTDG